MDFSLIKSNLNKFKDLKKNESNKGIIFTKSNNESNNNQITQIQVDEKETEDKLLQYENILKSKIENIINVQQELKQQNLMWKNNFDPKELYKMLEQHKQNERVNEIIKERGEMNLLLNDKQTNNDNDNDKSKSKLKHDSDIKQNSLNSLNCNFNNISFNFKCQELYIWINNCFQKWLHYIKDKNSQESNKIEARKRIGLYQQSKKFIRPLLKLLLEKNLPSHLVDKIFEAMIYCMNKDYIQSNQKYYELAIGLSPWPKGEKSFTIHSRYVDRSRTSADVAYILNDDITKKYLLAFKRILTINQKIFPNLPSLNVFS